MSWLSKIFNKTTLAISGKSSVPEGLWTKCSSCEQILFSAEVERNLNVCPKCDHHMRINARRRIDIFLDPKNRQELATDLQPQDLLKFKDSKRYKDRLAAAQKATGEKDAFIAFQGTVLGIPVIACSFEFAFMGGSMGAVVGARFAKAAQAAIDYNCGLVCFSTSGGARMQEALTSLMQMAKTSAVLEKLSASRLPYISVLTDPTMGGVSASLAMLGDINIAEPKALIGFAGRRVIEQTVRETLADDFQKSEFLLEHGAIDMIIDRRHLRERIGSLLAKLTNYDSPIKPLTITNSNEDPYIVP